MDALLAINIGAPVLSGFACLVLTGRNSRRAIVSVMSVLLIASSILMLSTGGFSYSPFPFSETIVAILDMAVISYFLAVGLRRRNPIVTGLSLVQLVPLAYFELAANRWGNAPVFLVDGLAILISSVVNVVGSLVCIYALGYMEEHGGGAEGTRLPQFFFFMLLFLGVMNGLVYSNSTLWLCFFWETTTLCCYELIRYSRTSEAERNAEVALWMGLIGGASLVGGLFIGHYTFGVDSLTELATLGPHPLLMLWFALFGLTGFTKSAQIPFHSWLIGAMVAPTPVSALLHSSTMVNAGVYLILRFSTAMEGTPLAWTIGLLGGVTFATTAFMAVSQKDSKRILAYSTSGNLGLIIMCASVGTALAYSAALLLLIFHAVSKGLLFMGAGAIENRVGTRNVEGWEGILGRIPKTTAVMAIAMVSMFLPPFGMLFGKWTALEALASAPALVTLFMAFLLVVGSAATTLFWAKWLGYLLILPVQNSKHAGEAMPFTYRVSMGGLLAILAGSSVGVFLLLDRLAAPGDGTWQIVMMVAPLFEIGTGAGTFPVLVLWLGSFAILALGYALFRLKGGEKKLPYIGGENVEGEPIKFRTTADREDELRVEGVYPSSMSVGMDRYTILLGIALIVTMFLVVVF